MFAKWILRYYGWLLGGIYVWGFVMRLLGCPAVC